MNNIKTEGIARLSLILVSATAATLAIFTFTVMAVISSAAPIAA